MRLPRKHITIFLAMAFAGATGAKEAEAPSSSREIYEMSLERTSGYLLTAHGRTVVETHNGCGNIHALQRSLSDVTYKDGQPIRTDFVIETWESAAGLSLRFHTRHTQSGNGTETHEGIAKLTTNGGQVTFASHEKPFALPRGTIFPAAFSRAMTAAAMKHQDLSNRIVFQGGDRKAIVTAAVKIGNRLHKVHEAAKDPDGLLKGAAAWPVLISYFPASEDLPASEVAATVYPNGLVGSFSLIYPQYTLRAKLVRVERLPSAC